MSEMRREQNVGTLDSWVRVAGGLFLLALGTSGRLGRVGSVVSMALGAGTVADGVTRYCPYYKMTGVSTVERDQARRSIDASRLNRSGVEQLVEETDPVPRSVPWERPAQSRVEESEQAQSTIDPSYGSQRTSGTNATGQSEGQRGSSGPNGSNGSSGESSSSRAFTAPGPKSATTRRI